MNARRVSWGIGWTLMAFSVTFVVPFVISFIYDLSMAGIYSATAALPWSDLDTHVPRTGLVFLLAAVATATAGLLLHAWGVEDANLRPREGYAIVGVGYLLMTVFGAIPYLLIANMGPVDAFFESMSGISTTGATVMATPLADHAPSLMMWRATQQWIGGMGIIVLSVALLASLTHGGHQLLSAEAPGLQMERIRPKIIQTAQILWSIYGIFTLVLFSILVPLIHLTGVRLPWKQAVYEAMLHTMTSVSSGGFSNHDASIGYFDSVWVELAIGITMFLVVLNFTRHYLSFKDRSLRHFLHDPETRLFVVITAGVMAFVSLVLIWQGGYEVGPGVRAGSLQSLAIVTTTGYTPAVFDEWPDAARLMLLFMFFTGGCAGSTAGGLKVIRILVLMKLIGREIRKLLHPKAVIPIRIGKSVINEDIIKTVAVFFFTYVTLFIFSTIGMTLLGLDLVSAISAVAASIGNIGPALGTVHHTYADVPAVGKIWLALLMWAGRLEVFTALILFFPSTWRR